MRDSKSFGRVGKDSQILSLPVLRRMFASECSLSNGRAVSATEPFSKNRMFQEANAVSLKAIENHNGADRANASPKRVVTSDR